MKIGSRKAYVAGAEKAEVSLGKVVLYEERWRGK